ncbi:hypothetical protein [Chryseobacterium echinoideorum]|uniref:hypothetical protein n=1 Tax=Chryseobacterium echinoideorum TaxID=1549648 RepID=UPI001186BC98|nr:hypothetical protein [Chryseobacterium echinoideorum]
MNKLTTREQLKSYFETGDFPTENEFAELINSYAHLNEFNFGLSIRSSGNTSSRYYDFYKADDIMNSGAGHKIVESSPENIAAKIEGYSHVLSRIVCYKSLDIKLIGEIDIEKHQPKIIIERYKQRKRMPNGNTKPAGFYQEKMSDAELWNRKSEYLIKSNETVIDIEPIHYFRPAANFKEFLPSGSINRPGSFKYTKYRKPFTVIQATLEININGTAYRSRPVGIKIILGSSGEYDAVNFVFN